MIAAFTKPTSNLRPAVWTIGAMGLLLLTFLISAVANDTYNVIRLGHLLVWGFVMIFLATGQIDPPSLARGMAIGLVFGTVHGIITLPTSHYYGRLTGYLGDPNAAGYVLLTYGLVCLALLRSKVWRVVVGLTMVTGIVLTYSRTTWLAAIICLVWLLLPRRIPLLIRAIGGIAVYLLIVPVADSLSNSGVFRDRVGSDHLRLRISAAEQSMVDTSGWFGHAPAPLKVNVDGMEFYFHSSYQLLRAETGWLSVIAAAILLVAVIYRLLHPGPLGSSPWLEAAAIAPFVCALSIGNVLLDYPTAVTAGTICWWTGFGNARSGTA